MPYRYSGLVYRDLTHYAAHGEAAAVVLVQADNRAQLQFRHGRDDDEEHVQLEIETRSEPDKRGRIRSQFASVSFTKAQWEQVVEHVREIRTIPRPDYREASATMAREETAALKPRLDFVNNRGE